jgi:chromosome segregation ATPase
MASLMLLACAQPTPAPTGAELDALTQRLQRLEDRVDRLERQATSQPSPPLRSRAEIERNIQSLEQQRAVLLQRLTPAHPEVREIDLSLRLLRLQLDMLGPADRAPK